MKRLCCAIAMLIWPTHGISDGQATCAAGWTELAGMLGVSGRETVSAVDDGWCRVDLRNPEFVAAQFERAAFRLDQVADQDDDSRSVELRLTGMTTPFGVFDGNATLSIQKDTGAARIHELRLRGDDGRGIAMSADVDLDGFLTFARPEARPTRERPAFVNLDFMVTPAALDTLQIDFSQVTRSAMDSALRDVPQTRVSGKTRREFLRFMGAMPNARGTLEVRVQLSENARLFDAISPFLMLARTPSEADIRRSFAAATSGAQIDVTWKPGRM